MNVLDRVIASDAIPERALRLGIRANLATRLRRERAKGEDEREAFVAGLRHSPIAAVPAKANEQHYEVPPEFFELVLGPRMKYSSCYWPEGVETLAGAEEAMLALTCERARIEDGQRILDLGCGWGSFALYAAERFPGARITAVSNSRLQREWIEARAPANLEVITADVNELVLERRFDRVVSVEMFEHMRNYEALMARVARAARGRRPAVRPSLLPSQLRLCVRLELDGAALLHRRDDAVCRPAAELRPTTFASSRPGSSTGRTTRAPPRRGSRTCARTRPRSPRVSAARSSPTGASSSSPARSCGATATARSGSSGTTCSSAETAAPRRLPRVTADTEQAWPCAASSPASAAACG